VVEDARLPVDLVNTDLTVAENELRHQVVTENMQFTEKWTLLPATGLTTPAESIWRTPNRLLLVDAHSIVAGGRNPDGSVNAAVLRVPDFIRPRTWTTSPYLRYWQVWKAPPKSTHEFVNVTAVHAVSANDAFKSAAVRTSVAAHVFGTVKSNS
jgi:hypothetical protein